MTTKIKNFVSFQAMADPIWSTSCNFFIEVTPMVANIFFISFFVNLFSNLVPNLSNESVAIK